MPFGHHNTPHLNKEFVMPGETTHTYEVTWVPEACKAYHVGDRLRLIVGNQPPASMTLNYGGDCNGIIATLIS